MVIECLNIFGVKSLLERARGFRTEHTWAQTPAPPKKGREKKKKNKEECTCHPVSIKSIKVLKVLKDELRTRTMFGPQVDAQ